MASQKNFLLVGILFTVIFVTRFVVSLLTDTVSVVELFNWGSIVYMTSAIAYLFPQFKHKDERVEAIKQKGVFYSVFVVLVVLIALMILVQFNMLMLTTLEIIRVMISVIIVTVWTSWMILSKKM